MASIYVVILALLFAAALEVTSSQVCRGSNGEECKILLEICRGPFAKNDSTGEICSRIFANSSTSLHSEDFSQGEKRQPSSAAVWGYGLLSVTIISAMSVIGVTFLPLMSKSFYDLFLTSLIGLAVGSLSGSAIFHLIPSAFCLADFDIYEHHSYLEIAMVVWAGIYLFFVIERALKIIMEYKSRRALQPHESENVASQPLKLANLSEEENGIPEQVCSGTAPLQVYENSMVAMRSSFGHIEKPDQPDSRPTVEIIREIDTGSKIATVAWMIIFGDGVHNFIDGLSIGAAFSQNALTGISVSLAVLCEEFPHELGDFAVLLNSGMTVKQAMLYNFLSACTCYLGLILGILLGEMQLGSQYIFAAAGGMFLYIALVDMVPELNATMDQLSKISVKSALQVFFFQNIGILAGIFSLFILAKFQDSIQIDF